MPVCLWADDAHETEALRGLEEFLDEQFSVIKKSSSYTHATQEIRRCNASALIVDVILPYGRGQPGPDPYLGLQLVAETVEEPPANLKCICVLTVVDRKKLDKEYEALRVGWEKDGRRMMYRSKLEVLAGMNEEFAREVAEAAQIGDQE